MENERSLRLYQNLLFKTSYKERHGPKWLNIDQIITIKIELNISRIKPPQFDCGSVGVPLFREAKQKL